jgi:DNA-binding LacI/PurR family transcriptional regulator
MANIKDIAKLAGVSVTTISRVINGHPYVSEEKREAVMRAMEETNYERNINAVHLIKGKTNLIGVMVPSIKRPYFGLVVEGIAEEALKGIYKLVLIVLNITTFAIPLTEIGRELFRKVMTGEFDQQEIPVRLIVDELKRNTLWAY